MLATKGMRFPIDVILVCIRWYAAYPLSYRHLEEVMQERGVFVDHSSINRWAIRFLPLHEKVFRKHKRPVGASWRMDETGSVALSADECDFDGDECQSLKQDGFSLPTHKTGRQTTARCSLSAGADLYGSCA